MSNKIPESVLAQPACRACAAAVPCDFDECEHAATKYRGCMRYCAQHAAEHDANMAEARGK
jgi:hypothetical protein